MTIGTRLYTFFSGKLLGEDPYGNRYYEERRTAKGGRRKRWVLYKGTPEPTKVPALWHGWLHYTIDQFPSKDGVVHHVWEKPHIPNLTGTAGRYVPPGHVTRGADREASTSDYVAWTPRS